LVSQKKERSQKHTFDINSCTKGGAMKYVIALAIAIAMTFTMPARAQTWRNVHSSTAREGALRGAASLRASQGYFLRNLGRYNILNQEAHSLAIENHLKRVHTWWQLRDENRARWHRDNPTWLEKESHRLDMAEQAHALKIRRQKLIEQGVLPKPPEKSFTYNYKTYKSYEDFKKTNDWVKMSFGAILRQEERKLELEKSSTKISESLEFQAWYNSLSYAQKKQYSGRLKEEHKNYNDKDYVQKKAAIKFYSARPYLKPMAGKNGLPPWPFDD